MINGEDQTTELEGVERISPIPDSLPKLITKYGDKNFAVPEYYAPHNAIDIFVEPYTQIVAPENGILCYRISDCYDRGFDDIGFLGDSGVFYLMLHTHPGTTNDTLRKACGVNGVIPVRKEIGEQIGTVGQWPQHFTSLKNDMELLNSVKSDGSHLHLEVYKGPYNLEYLLSNMENIKENEERINPKDILKITGREVSKGKFVPRNQLEK